MEALLPLLGFILVATITPGPNNMLLAAVGMQFGVRAAIPQVLGIHAGMYTLSLLCALGMNQVLGQGSLALFTIKLFGSVYLVYLAWKIIGIRLVSEAQGAAKPLTFFQSFLFQLSNPKAWMMTTTGIGIALAATPSLVPALSALITGFATLGMACNLSWVAAGSRLQGLYRNRVYRAWINGVLALLTLVSVIWFWVA